MTDPDPAPDDEARDAGFDAVLLQILQAEDADEPRGPDVWVAEFPDYRAELLEYFADRDFVAGSSRRMNTGRLPDFPGHEVIREVGRGGMGVVYEARQLDPPRIVALKALLTSRLRTPVERVRFRREAQVAARLEHSGIVPVYTIGEADGIPYYTMRLAAGGPLSRVLDRYQADPRAAARLVADLARAVHHAHQRAVLHRDLKPSNILLDLEGRACVADFGLVRDLTDPDPLTATADLVGTPQYMAPEQTLANGGPCTVATDVYGLGCVLYACLTGRSPFAGSNTASILLQVRETEPEAPVRLNPGVRRELDAVCRKCLEKDPAARYPSADALADDLDRFLRGLPVHARPLGPVRRAGRLVRRHPVLIAMTAVAAIAIITAVGVGAWHWGREERHQIELKASRDIAERERFFAGLERVRQRRGDPYVTWSQESLADLRELSALPSAAGHLHDLRSEAAAALAATDLRQGSLVADFPAYASHFSADNRWLAVAGWTANTRGRVDLIDRRTNARRELNFPVDAKWQGRVGRPDGARSIRFSPDGNWLVVGTRSGWLVRWDMNNLSAAPYAWPGHTEDSSDPRFVAVKTVGFTADGQTLLTSSIEAIRGWTVKDGQATSLLLKGSRLPADFYPLHDQLAVYGPAGRRGKYGLLQVAKRDFVPDWFDGLPVSCLGPDPLLMAYQPDEGTGICTRFAHPSARPRPLERWEDRSLPSHLTFAPAGNLVAAVYEHELRLRVWDVAGGALLAERTTDDQVTHATFSPDGGELVLSGMSGARAYVVPRGLLETVAVVADPEVTSIACPSDHSRVMVLSCSPGVAANRYLVSLAPDRTGPPGRGESIKLEPFYRWSDIAPDGRGLVVSGEHGENLVQDESGARLFARDLSDVRFGPDGRLWVLENQHLRVGSVTGGAPVVWRNDQPSQAAGSTLKCVVPGRQAVLIGRRDGQVIRLDLAGKFIDSSMVIDHAILSLAVDADELQAAAGGERGEVCLLGLATRNVTAIPDAHRAAVRSVAYGPGFLVTGSADHRVRLWTSNGQPIATLSMRGPVAKVLVSADGSSLVVQVGGERAVRRWRLDLLFEEWVRLGLDPRIELK